MSVTVEQRGEQLAVSIRDTGVGVAPELFEHIFDEFRQADSSVSREFGGTGLGLSIARKLAVLQGGSLTVTSQLGVGSTFTLLLPPAPAL